MVSFRVTSDCFQVVIGTTDGAVTYHLTVDDNTTHDLYWIYLQVYGYMDKYRRETKQIKARSNESARAARIAVARRRRRHHDDRSRPQTATAIPDGQGHASPLRRYSDLNLGVMPPSATTAAREARPATSGGYHR